MNKSNSPTFCVLPWMHLATNASGNVRLCCNSKPVANLIRDSHGEPYILNSGAKLTEIWNAPTFKTVRRQMLRGEWPEACVRCQREEQTGIRSARLSWNETYADSIPSALSDTSEDGEIPLKLRYLDLRLGNFCNLKCRMCNPFASRKWLEDWDQVFTPLPASETARLGKLDWFEDPRAWDLLQQSLDSVDLIYFTGGEPLLIDAHQRLLRECISRDLAKNMTLKYNTNLTLLPPELLKLWEHFKIIRVNASLDAIGELNEYIRHPSHWEGVNKNIARLEELARGNKRMLLTFHVTVQAYNFLRLPELLDFVAARTSFRRLPYLNILDRPEHLNIRQLPRELKELGARRLSEWLEGNADFLRGQDPIYVDKWRRLLDYAFAEPAEAEHFLKFKATTRRLDEMRSQSLVRLIPEFAAHW